MTFLHPPFFPSYISAWFRQSFLVSVHNARISMKARRCMRVYMYITNGDNTLLSLYLTYQYFVSRRAGRKSEKKSLKSKCDGIYEKRLRHYFYYVILRINAEQLDRIRHAWVRFHCLITIIYFCVYIYICLVCVCMCVSICVHRMEQ